MSDKLELPRKVEETLKNSKVPNDLLDELDKQLAQSGVSYKDFVIARIKRYLKECRENKGRKV